MADRLVKLCGMLGSAHAGERANAAEAADRLVRAAGLTWADIIGVNASTWEEPETVEEMVGAALAYPDAVTAWERKFLLSIAGRRTLSPKQQDVLERIVERVRAYAARAA
jgi:hypothetical protein